ncbi:hypothetical protein M406DRAFT_67720 [Cryphonectria parasitica EP155]|uniref:Uncharacterized protein n=1 Tax=Cryphonectria parasitica (strain ATCC 38755 / EP155) TaxID=660469 RepID=A0A9P4YF14_CRYP1|nr:uncharacterized protein M406DRAFT_67720 [Cryphonectria parasitica EP155]KAF3771417.1 hypothetical protein M406DRAFT_67720 [Cryphonectria parasitica EP155]
MAKFSFFFLLAALLGVALATTVPNPVYRADTRNPDKIKAAGGFKSFGTNSEITLIEHASKQYAKGHRQGQDPWISTSALTSVGESSVVDKPCWVYTIDTSSIASSFTEVAAAYKAANKPYTHASEEEWAAKLQIPLSSITSFYQLKKDGTKGPSYTWTTWEAKAAKKTSRDEIPVMKKAGTPGAAAFRALAQD